MKNLLLFSLGFFLLTGCELVNTSPVTQADKILELSAKKNNSNNINICHNSEEDDSWKLIKVNINSLVAHLAHGDVRLDDQDGDGFVPNNACGFGEMGDCDDTNPNVYPGAEEVCGNGVDDNCNGETDEGSTTIYYADVDGDGYGNSGSTVTACTQPADYVTEGGDCDDNDATINPGAPEVCGDGKDNDCDGQIDQNDSDCPPLQIGDTYGGGIIFYLDGNGGGLVVTATEVTAPTLYADQAIAFCENYSDGTYDDWYLPTIAELKLMWQNLHRFGCSNVAPDSSPCPTSKGNFMTGFINQWGSLSVYSYWSSTPVTTQYGDDGWATLRFYNGVEDSDNDANFEIRAVRLF